MVCKNAQSMIASFRQLEVEISILGRKGSSWETRECKKTAYQKERPQNKPNNILMKKSGQLIP
jgi:hypothetical protein